MRAEPAREEWMPAPTEREPLPFDDPPLDPALEQGADSPWFGPD